jgi:TonB family protein
MTLLLAGTIRISLMLLIALLACALLRHRSAALRHWVLAAAIACGAAMPLLQVVVPAWSLSVNAGAEPLLPSAAISPAANTPLAVAAPAVKGVVPPPARGAAGDPPWRGWSSGRLPQIVLAVWAVGLAIAAAILAAGLLRLSQIAAAARRADDRWSPLVAELSGSFGIRCRVAVLEIDHPVLVVTWGWRRPKILVPRAAAEWSAERLRVVFSHELAHIQRGDWIVQIGADVFRAACWFNPLVWIACRRLRQESEHACDDAVLNLGAEAPAYAAHLLDLARASRRHRAAWLPAPAIVNPSSLERRVTAMLNSATNRAPVSRWGRTIAAAALLAAALPLAGLAQGGATLSGTARDESGGLLPGLSLTLELQDQQRPRLTVSAATDRSGHYEFTGLPNGRYLLQAQLAGFTTYTEALTVAVNARVEKNLTLRIGELQETITVTGTPGQGRTSDPRIQQLRRPRGSAPVGVPPVARAAGGIGGNIKAPRKIHDARPEYPAVALAAGVGGVVKLQATIAGDGFVTDVRTIASPSDDLARAAADAVSQWEFTPTLLNGAAVDVRMSVTVQFDPGR